MGSFNDFKNIPNKVTSNMKAASKETLQKQAYPFFTLKCLLLQAMYYIGKWLITKIKYRWMHVSLWVENISHSLKQNVAGKKFCLRWVNEFMNFMSLYIFLLKVLLYLLAIFWKIRIATLYEENGSMEISLNTLFWQFFTNIKTLAFLKHRITKQSFK